MANCPVQNSILVIGAGIAGLSCVEALFHDFDSQEKNDRKYNQVILLSNSRLIKKVANYSISGRQLESFDVVEGTIDGLEEQVPDGLNFRFIVGTVKCIDARDQRVFYNPVDDRGCYSIKQQDEIKYNKLCICLGATPRHLNIPNWTQKIRENVIVIRDTDTVLSLQKKLKTCLKLVIIGNGGIGLELITNISNCQKIWLIRDDSIGSAYFDSGAAKFLLDSIKDKQQILSSKEILYHQEDKIHIPKSNYGPSLGPNWSQSLEFKGDFCCHDKNNLDIIYNDEVTEIVENPDGFHLLKVITKKGKIIDCDLVATAIGVDPNKLKFINDKPNLSSSDSGILIDEEMRTSIQNIYAAGDIVSCNDWKPTDLWFQRRLWTQARQMGYYAGRCIAANLQGVDPSLYFNFDCFTHCTSFFGYKVVLLGQYNAQNCDSKVRVKARVKPGQDYVKIVVNEKGRIVGAVLVGQSGLEETIENLIHDKIDISSMEAELLDETIDIEDYFD